MKKIIIVIVSLIFIYLLYNSHIITEQLNYYYFDTPIEISITDQKKNLKDIDQIDSDIQAILSPLHQMFDYNNPDSLINQVNQNKTTQINQDFYNVLAPSIDACKQSNELYDPTIGAVSYIWKEDDNIPPDTSLINNNLQYIDCQKIELTKDTITKPENVQIDVNSAVKGYATDQITTYLRDQNLVNSTINMGGNVAVLDSPDDDLYTVGIESPERNNNQPVASLTIENNSVVTTGPYERGYTYQDTYYHHLLNTTTGQPENNDLASVTIITESSLEADIIATTCYLAGLSLAQTIVNELDNTEAIFITNDKEIYSTDTSINLNVLDDRYTLV